MMHLDRFIRDMTDCLGWPYTSPGGTDKDCSRSGIDCSGLLVRAYKLQGETLYHGSNYIWRHELTDKGKLTGVRQLQVGMAVFKWSASGEPERYKSDGEGNFHHIGVVTSVEPLRITHASSVAGKVKQDTVIGKWSHWGKLKAVQYAAEREDTKIMSKYRVTAATGDTVNLRRNTSTSSDCVERVKVGTVVDAEPYQEGWMRVQTENASGYMVSKFLTPAQEGTSLEERVKRLEERVAALEGGVG